MRSAVLFTVLLAACSSSSSSPSDGPPADSGASSPGADASQTDAGADDARTATGDGAAPGADAGADGTDTDGASSSTAVVAVSCADYFSCALLSNGDVLCFGDNKAAELGNGHLDQGGATPSKVLLPGPASLVASHDSSSCAAVGTEIYCWGGNSYGQLGSGSAQPINVSSPVRVAGLSGNVQGIALGIGHTCALVDGAVWCWGYNNFGELGDGTNTDSLVPVKAVASGATAVSAGDFHSCAIVQGAVKCWGLNNGQIGDGTTDDRNTPTAAKSATSATFVAAGSDVTCAVLGGAVSCWGEPDNNTLGVKGDAALLEPHALPELASGATSLSANMGGCAITAGGGLSCWGEYPGDGSASSPTPVAVGNALATGTTASCVGWQQRCAVNAGRLYCWGKNGSGEIGIGVDQTPNGVLAKPQLVAL